MDMEGGNRAEGLEQPLDDLDETLADILWGVPQ